MATILAPLLVPVDVLVFDNIDYLRVLPRLVPTEHPVEFGADVTDHVRKEPLIVELRGRVSATKFVVPVPGAKELAIAWFERNAGQLVILTSSRGIFTNMMIQRYDWGNEGRDEVVFDVTMKEIRTAFAVSVLIPPRTPAPPLQTGAPSTAGAGVQAAAAASAPASLLASVASLIGG